MKKHRCHHPLSEEAIKTILDQKGINRTKSKIKILQVLSQSEKPLSVTEIHTLLNESCDVSTVFRSITQFKEKNLIQEVNFEEGFFRYELSLHQEKHHHHVRCRKCGDVRNIEQCNLEAFEKAIKAMGFKEMEHKLEFTGLCSKCFSKT